MEQTHKKYYNLFAFVLYPNSSFLDLTVSSHNSQHNVAAYIIEKASFISKLFLVSDFILYFSIVLLILLLGLNYKSFSTYKLSSFLLKFSTLSLYTSFLINSCGVILGYEIITNYNLSFFNESYTFNLFSQLSKIVLVTICGCLYSFFPRLYISKIQIIEVLVLIQISVALCCTLLSATNLALLLLAL